MSEHDDFIKSVHRYADDLRQERILKRQLIDDLVKTISDDASAYRVLNELREAHARAQGRIHARVVKAQHRRSRRDAGWNDLVWGGMLCLGGITANVGLFVSGGVQSAHLIFLGAIVYGAIRFFAGLSKYIDAS